MNANVSFFVPKVFHFFPVVQILQVVWYAYYLSFNLLRGESFQRVMRPLFSQ